MTESMVSRETVADEDVSAAMHGLGWPVRPVSSAHPVGWQVGWQGVSRETEEAQ